MKYVIDIDGTICTHMENYVEATPYQNRINFVNKLYDDGHTIIYFTARGSETKINWREITEFQLKQWGAKYHELIFGKPSADFYIDDKNLDIFEMNR